MILFEHEGKNLLKVAGLSVPDSLLVSDPASFHWDDQRLPAVVKAQTPFGKRLQHGGIQFAETQSELKHAISGLLGAILERICG